MESDVPKLGFYDENRGRVGVKTVILTRKTPRIRWTWGEIGCGAGEGRETMRAEEVNKAGSGQGGGVSRRRGGVFRREAVAVGETVRVFRREMRVRGGEGAEFLLEISPTGFASSAVGAGRGAVCSPEQEEE